MPAWIELGLMYRRQGQRSLALDTFARAAKIAPQNQRLILEPG
ncbi:MAG: tetratricopeptide repeat protein [Cyanobacteria bacterium J06623_1]